MIEFQETILVRKPPECSMRAFQRKFRRMKDSFVYDQHGKWKLVIRTTLLLSKFREVVVGISQKIGSYINHLGVEEKFFLRKKLAVQQQRLLRFLSRNCELEDCFEITITITSIYLFSIFSHDLGVAALLSAIILDFCVRKYALVPPSPSSVVIEEYVLS